jgi:hypothetical protein
MSDGRSTKTVVAIMGVLDRSWPTRILEVNFPGRRGGLDIDFKLRSIKPWIPRPAVRVHVTYELHCATTDRGAIRMRTRDRMI